MKIKIQPASVTLCARCRYGQIISYAHGGTDVFCHVGSMYPTPIHHVVVSCNEMEARNTTSRHDFEQIAWTVTTDKSGKTIGFHPPTKKADE